MAPIKATTKPGGDIRAFFGGGGGSGGQPKPKPKPMPTSRPPAQSQGTSQKQPITIDLSDDDSPLPAPQRVPPKVGAAAESMAVSSPPKPKPPRVSDPAPAPAPAPVKPTPSTSKPDAPKPKRKSLVLSDSELDEEEEEEEESKPAKKAPRLAKGSGATSARPKSKQTQAKKRKDDAYEEEDDDVDMDDDDFVVPDDEEDVKLKKKAKPRASTSKGDKGEKGKETKAKAKPKLRESNATAAGAGEEEKPKPKPKFNFGPRAGPSAPGSKAIPLGAADCLSGLTFVFTGELSSLARDEAIELVKRYGGRVTGQPSSKTSYVVLGHDAGQSKLNTIQKHGLATLDEDGLLGMIGTREAVRDEKALKREREEERRIREQAREMEVREKEAAAAASLVGNKGKGKEVAGPTQQQQPANQLWTVRYTPQTVGEICGNKGLVEKLQRWLADWPKNLKSNFSKPGKDGTGIFRAMLLTGPPGIGKTTSAHLVAKLEGYTVVEVNASDARSKKMVQSHTNITDKSLDGWLAGGPDTLAAGVALTDRSVLIMDEVDGMSGSDRGGIGALNALIRKTKVPIICIANERNIPKMKPLQSTTYSLQFRRPDAKAVRSRMMSIIFKEKMKIPPNVVDQLVTGVQSDIRQVLNMLSTWKLSSSTMDFDESKQLAAMNEKYSAMTPWSVIEKLFGPYLFSATARETLNDKMEYYFYDYSFVPLFIEENYAKVTPSRVRNMDGPEKEMKHLELLEKAATCISDGDLVDAMIHGPEQQWSLMPLHAVTSTIYPASQIYGQGGHWGSPNAFSFPQFLGQNSKMQALRRQLSEVQARMRPKVSGDKEDIRLTYIPFLMPRMVEPLIEKGSSAVDEIIHLMDEYYLSKDEWDTILELGVGDNKGENYLKKISSATKATFTKKYNAGDHPIVFNRAQDISMSLASKKAEVPDLEEAFEPDDEPEDDEDEKPSRKKKDPTGIADDKLLKVAKGKAAAKPRGKKSVY